jgi:uncharacterized protein (TIRG00374 family)
MHRRTIKTITIVVGGLLLGVELVLMRHQLAAAVRVLSGARPLWVVTAAAATLVSMQCFARTQRRMLHAADPAASSNVTLARMVGLTYTANALNMTLPAGSAVSVTYMVNRLRGWGSPNAAAVFTVVASGTLSSATFFALAAGCGLAAGTFGRWGTSTDLALVATMTVLIVALAVRRRRSSNIGGWVRPVLGRVERRLRRISVRGADALCDAVDGLAAVHPRRRDWMAGAGLAAVNWLADFVCLLASCHAVGVSVTDPVVLLTAYLAGMSASSIAFVPGGFGVIEVAMIAALHAGGVLTTPATATVLLYRMISCVCVVAAGWAVWSCRALTRLHHHQRNAPSATC